MIAITTIGEAACKGFCDGCAFFALEYCAKERIIRRVKPLGDSMSKMVAWKKVALALALVITSLSLGGCFVGKGKAPPPIATRG